MVQMYLKLSEKQYNNLKINVLLYFVKVFPYL
jgi:hypothetical protein